MRYSIKPLYFTIALCLSFLGSSSGAQERCEQVFRSIASFDTQKSWTLQALQSEFKTLDDFFVNNKGRADEEKIQALMGQDLRRSFFRFQALSRMLESQNPSFFAAKRTQFKALEDVIGQLDLATSLLRNAEKLNEPQLIQLFSLQQIKAKSDIVTQMKNSGFWTKPEETLNTLKEEFEKEGHWQNGQEERMFLVSIHAEYISALHKAVEANKFDHPDIEKGLHELRRRLRWIVIQLAAMDGLVEFKKEPELPASLRSWFGELEQSNPQILESKYLNKQNIFVDKPLQIPEYELAIISELVGKIGSFKDAAEMQIYFAQALDELKVDLPQKGKVLEKLNQLLKVERVDHQALVREIQARLAESKLLKNYVEILGTMNSNQ